MKKPATWKTKDGKVIPIKDMSNKHLKNTILMLGKAAYRYSMTRIEELLIAGSPNGDAASHAFDHEMDMYMHIEPENIFPEYINLRTEAVKRGLKI